MKFQQCEKEIEEKDCVRVRSNREENRIPKNIKKSYFFLFYVI